MYTNTTGGYNSSFGISSLYSNTTGANNAAFGNDAYSNTISDKNIAFGESAKGLIQKVVIMLQLKRMQVIPTILEAVIYFLGTVQVIQMMVMIMYLLAMKLVMKPVLISYTFPIVPPKSDHW